MGKSDMIDAWCPWGFDSELPPVLAFVFLLAAGVLCATTLVPIPVFPPSSITKSCLRKDLYPLSFASSPYPRFLIGTGV